MSKKKDSLSKNGVFYLIYNVLNMAFPFLTGMYVSRVLLPESIGTVAAAQNFAQYFVILAFLGIPTYGLREISKVRNNDEERSKVFSELFLINLTSTIVFSIIYLILIFSIPEYRKDIILFLVVGISIVLNAFNISWLYEGMEEFKFISIRNVIFKGVSFGFLFLTVRSEKDILLYALVTVVGTAGNYIINMICAPKRAKFTIHGLNLRRHMKSIFFLVAVNLAIELYSLVDITMMNFLCDKDSIAFYKYAIAIKNILMQIVNTFTMVLVPRISFYYKEGLLDDFNKLLSKAFKLIIMVSLPIIVGLYFTADSIMVKLYGEPYIASASILKLLSVLLLISPIGYLLGSRVLLATGHENKMIICVGLGAAVNIVGNALLIPIYAANGASFASVFSEIVVMIVYVCMGKKYFSLIDIKKSIFMYIAANIIMGLFLFVCTFLDLNEVLVLIIQIVGATIVYTGALVILKEEIVLNYLSLLKMKLIKGVK